MEVMLEGGCAFEGRDMKNVEKVGDLGWSER